jgi:hypothetical protein
MDLPAWLIPLSLAGLWACYYYRYGYLERELDKSEREPKQEDILLGVPIEPKHANPKLRGRRIPDSLRRFFADFGRFGVIINNWPPIKDGPWRLQERKDTRLRTFNDDSPKQGRRYDVFYNQQRLGSVEITDTAGYTTEAPRVRANIVIQDARLIAFDEISRFLTSIATLLSAGTGDEYAEARSNVETALTRAHQARGWEAGPLAIEVSFLGSAATYIKLRDRQGEAHRVA